MHVKVGIFLPRRMRKKYTVSKDFFTAKGAKERAEAREEARRSAAYAAKRTAGDLK